MKHIKNNQCNSFIISFLEFKRVFKEKTELKTDARPEEIDDISNDINQHVPGLRIVKKGEKSTIDTIDTSSDNTAEQVKTIIDKEQKKTDIKETLENANSPNSLERDFARIELRKYIETNSKVIKKSEDINERFKKGDFMVITGNGANEKTLYFVHTNGDIIEFDHTPIQGKSFEELIAGLKNAKVIQTGKGIDIAKEIKSIIT